MKNELSAERPLIASEKLWWVLEATSGVNFSMHARVRGSLPREAIQAALTAIRDRHPLLRVNIQRTGWNRLEFREQAPPLSLDLVDGPPEDWIRHFEKELGERFNAAEGPLVRFVRIRHAPEDRTLLITFHHAVGDGMSGAFLMRDLLTAAARYMAGQDPALPVLEPRQGMTAYYPGFARGWSGYLGYLKYSLRILAAMAAHGLPARAPTSGRAPLDGRRPTITSLEFGHGFAERLHARAAENNTTLHGAMLAAMALAILRDEKTRPRRFILIGSPVNLRSRLAPPVGDDVGFFVTVGASMMPLDPGAEFWETAVHLRESLWNSVGRGEPFLYPYQHRDLSRLCGLFGLGPLGCKVYARAAELANMGGLTFSNIGRLAPDLPDAPFVMENLGFAANGTCISALCSFASTYKQRTCWNFMGMEPVLPRETATRLAESARSILENAL